VRKVHAAAMLDALNHGAVPSR